MKLNSHNEWDTLKEVVLGTANELSAGLEFSTEATSEEIESAVEVSQKAFPNWYRNEVEEDLDGILQILKQFGVKVARPRCTETSRVVSTGAWKACGSDIYNVRDLHLVVGDTLVVSPSPSKFRFLESFAFQVIWERYFEEGFRWIESPRPQLAGEYLIPYYRNGEEVITREDAVQKELMGGRIEKFHRLLENEILFEAANIVRLGRDLIYLVSSSGNYRGARWLQNVLGSEFNVHVVNSYRASHIDSTILPLKPGLVLLNAARVNEESCPKIFQSWDKLYFDDVAPVPAEELQFQKEIRDPIHRELSDRGVNNYLHHISSPWAGLNVLSLDPQTVLVHDRQQALIRELERRHFTVVPVRLRHCYTMLGGLHCVTLDTVRDSKLESYF